MGTKTTKAARDAAIARVLAKPEGEREAAMKDEARKLRVKLRYMKRIVTEARKGIVRPDPDFPGSDSLPWDDSDGDEDPSPDLDTARRSAGIGLDEGAEAHGGIPGPSDGSSIPAPPPRAVVAMASVIRSMSLKIYCVVLGLDPGEAEIQGAIEMSADERASLEEFAPYVASYFPELLGGEDGKVGAIAFAGVFGAGLWTAMAELRGYAKARRAEGPRRIIDVPEVREEPPDPRGGIPETSQDGEAMRTTGY